MFLADVIDALSFVCQNHLMWRSAGRDPRPSIGLAMLVASTRSATPSRSSTNPLRQTAPNRDDRIVFLGPDQNNIMLEVMAVETRAGLLVIHALRIRP
jgi:hypothetical protein